MLTSGYSWEGLTYGAFPGGEDPNNIYNLSYEENGGLGLLTGYVIDSHFSERGREGRLIRLVLYTLKANWNVIILLLKCAPGYSRH